ncbi:Tmemb_14 domain-containing protein [Cephalotus follicularis]|uniref:Tmemb_14 domain-containing protein n=1 Tax=Cephalotus follicularis TaxID=3775 RepID=A0A1Q3CIH0_CEPFO|nr:Tmemb_14 domain-containing protein [Cephalotus follicularis]
MTATISQLSCFSSISRKFQLHQRSILCPTNRLKLSVVMSLEGHRTDTTRSEIKTPLSYTADASISHVEGSVKSYPIIEENFDGKTTVDEPVQEHDISKQKRTAKIHDFCFGIPFGGLVVSGGLLGFIFSRNMTTLIIGVLFGGAFLALSILSLKIWRQGKSSLPFILGQAALSVALLWKNIQAYSLSKKLFPTGFYAVISAAMLFFYSYVMISGGNPPPKKLKYASSTS